MRPIEQRTDQTFNEALKAVSFRWPARSSVLQPGALQLALGLRYGLLGAAGAHFLLLGCPDREEPMLLGGLKHFGDMVEEHVRSILVHRAQTPVEALLFPKRVASLAREPIVSYLPLYRKMCPLELCLSVVTDQFTALHRSEIGAGTPWFARRAARREFQRLADESYAFALSFFERRQHGLEEVKEIALLGE